MRIYFGEWLGKVYRFGSNPDDLARRRVVRRVKPLYRLKEEPMLGHLDLAVVTVTASRLTQKLIPAPVRLDASLAVTSTVTLAASAG